VEWLESYATQEKRIDLDGFDSIQRYVKSSTTPLHRFALVLSGSGGLATVYSPRLLNFSSSNFAACHTTRPSAAYVDNNASQCTGRYLTIVLAAGMTGFDSKAAFSPLLESCSLFNNSLPDGSVRTDGTGILIEKCIFAHNACDIASDSCISAGLIQIANCIFAADGSALSSLCFSIGPGNNFSLLASSMWLSQMDALSCTVTVAQSRSPPVSPSPSMTFIPSLVFCSRGFHPSSLLPSSRLYRRTVRWPRLLWLL
jgi:hypothetical protein